VSYDAENIAVKLQRRGEHHLEVANGHRGVRYRGAASCEYVVIRRWRQRHAAVGADTGRVCANFKSMGPQRVVLSVDNGHEFGSRCEYMRGEYFFLL